MNGDLFPRLTTDNHRITSHASFDYNCVAWAAGDTHHWWQPGVHWPVPVSRNEAGIAALEQAFTVVGFTVCADEKLEAGFEKVALYGNNLMYTHAARQLPTGKWTSKLGEMEDIEHDAPDDVSGGLYGEVVQYMKRAIA
jgi:hypothetical protein